MSNIISPGSFDDPRHLESFHREMDALKANGSIRQGQIATAAAIRAADEQQPVVLPYAGTEATADIATVPEPSQMSDDWHNRPA